MKIYSYYGINDFIICLGYKGYIIKEYFANYFLHMSDVTFDMSQNSMEVHQQYSEPWKVTLVDTGSSTMTGSRLKRVAPFLNSNPFCFTYGDGVSDVNIKELLNFHKEGNLSGPLPRRVPVFWNCLRAVILFLFLPIQGLRIVHFFRQIQSHWFYNL